MYVAINLLNHPMPGPVSPSFLNWGRTLFSVHADSNVVDAELNVNGAQKNNPATGADAESIPEGHLLEAHV